MHCAAALVETSRSGKTHSGRGRKPETRKGRRWRRPRRGARGAKKESVRVDPTESRVNPTKTAEIGSGDKPDGFHTKTRRHEVIGVNWAF